MAAECGWESMCCCAALTGLVLAGCGRHHQGPVLNDVALLVAMCCCMRNSSRLCMGAGAAGVCWCCCRRCLGALIETH